MGGGFRRIEICGRGDDHKKLADASFARKIRREGDAGAVGSADKKGTSERVRSDGV